jgi:hypothetical protein
MSGNPLHRIATWPDGDRRFGGGVRYVRTRRSARTRAARAVRETSLKEEIDEEMD